MAEFPEICRICNHVLGKDTEFYAYKYFSEARFGLKVTCSNCKTKYHTDVALSDLDVHHMEEGQAEPRKASIKAMEDFEVAAVEFAERGCKHPEDVPGIKAYYKETKETLKKHLR